MSSDKYMPHHGPRVQFPGQRVSSRHAHGIDLSDPLRAMLGSFNDVVVGGQDPMVLDRIRALVSFCRGADPLQRQRRVDRFSRVEQLSAAINVLGCADELLSTALAGDRELFRHKLNVLLLTCGGDIDLYRAAGWRLRRLAVSPFFELHMDGSSTRRLLRRSLSQAIQLLERGRTDD